VCYNGNRAVTKYWQGATFDKSVVKHGDDEQEIVIAMTEEEFNDISYREYLAEACAEKTLDEMKAKPQKEPDPAKRRALGDFLKERQEFNQRQASEHPRKYW